MLTHERAMFFLRDTSIGNAIAELCTIFCGLSYLLWHIFVEKIAPGHSEKTEPRLHVMFDIRSEFHLGPRLIILHN